MQDTVSPNANTGSQPPVPPPPIGYTPRKRTRWWIPVAIIGGILVALVVIAGAIFGALFAGLSDFGGSAAPKPIKDKTVLVVDLSGGVEEHSEPNPFSFNTDMGSTDLLTILSAIRDAKSDKNIRGILIRAGGQVGITKLTEIREAIADFKKSGKFTYAFIEAGTRQHYYLASVADSIFMPQEGIVEFNALGATGMFFKQLSNKLGVEWHVEQFEEYKSAAESASREKWSDPAKQELREIIEQRQKLFVQAVASGRNLPEETVSQLLNEGVYLADSALKHKLIDGFAREDELKEKIARIVDPSDTSANPKLRTTSLSDYASRETDTEDVNEDAGIAIVYASGAIQTGSGDGLSNGIYSRTLIKNLRKAAANKDVKAILLRIDSPGGSAIASDDIWNTIREIRKTKPVYASMSDVAASGGYYIAMACDTIIAHPSTITGSIGVIMAIPNVSKTLNNIGITIDTISMGASSHFMNGSLPYSERDKNQLRTFGGGIYQRFVQKVADSRKKDYETTRALAKGRVWTGHDAFGNGLVDAVGGFHDALAMIKKRIGADPNKKSEVYIYPESEDLVKTILKMLKLTKDADDDTRTTTSTMQTMLAAAVQNGMPVSEFWKTLPPAVRAQFVHVAAIADISRTEQAMVMLPELFSTE